MDKTDRELLEAAAKAAGIELRYWAESQESFNLALTEPRRWWNPLADDGDALRLAVRLDIQFYFDIGINEVVAEWFDGKQCQDLRIYVGGGDKLSATRRAIVRAAAAMGK